MASFDREELYRRQVALREAIKREPLVLAHWINLAAVLKLLRETERGVVHA